MEITQYYQLIKDYIYEYLTNPWCSIILSLVSLFIGVVGLYAAFKSKHHKIEHQIRGINEVGKGLTEKFKNLSLTYNGDIITKNAWVIEGKLTNISDDIKIEKDNNEIEIRLPEDCNVLDISIHSSHDKLIVTNCVKDRRVNNNDVICYNTIVFKIEGGEIKSQDFFKYSVLLERPTNTWETRIEKSILVMQRFHNTIIVTGDDFLDIGIVLFFKIVIILMLPLLIYDMFTENVLRGSLGIIFCCLAFIFTTKRFRPYLFSYFRY